MSTETQIRTRHEFIESSGSKDHVKEKASQAHKDRGWLLKFMEDYNRINKSLLAELQSEQAERKQAESLLEHEYEKAEQRRMTRVPKVPTTEPRLH